MDAARAGLSALALAATTLLAAGPAPAQTPYYAGKEIRCDDPAFRADAEKQRLEIEEVSGEHLEQLLAATFALPQDRIDAAKAALGGAN